MNPVQVRINVFYPEINEFHDPGAVLRLHIHVGPCKELAEISVISIDICVIYGVVDLLSDDTGIFSTEFGNRYGACLVILAQLLRYIRI